MASFIQFGGRGANVINSVQDHVKLHILTSIAGATIIAGGLTMLFMGGVNTTLGTVGGVVVTLGAPMFVTGVIMLVFLKCMAKEKETSEK